MKSFFCILWQYKYVIAIFIFYSILAFALNARISNAIGNGLLILLVLIFIAQIKKYNIWTKILAYILLFLFSIFIATDIFYFYEFKTQIPLAVIASIAETTVRESGSMMKVYWLPSLISLLLVVSINTFFVKKISKIKLVNGWIALILVFPLFMLFMGLLYLRADSEKKDSIRYDLAVQPSIGLQFHYGEMFPILASDIILITSYYAEINRFKDYANSPKTLPDSFTIDVENKTKPTKIYVVLGESASRDHYSLYGYNKSTTPFLDQLSQDNDSAMVYYEAISPACVTRDAVRLIFSFATPNDINPFFYNKTILNLANDIGYQTVWLSNQEKMGVFDSYVSCIAAQADSTLFLTSTSKYQTVDDWNLIKTLPEFISKGKKQFVVLHLQGSHMEYGDKSTKEDILINEDENPIIKAYDRSIHHTDTFLSQLYDFVRSQNEDALIYYVSDHGENVLATNYEGHGSFRGTAQYRIPLLMINYKTKVEPSNITNKYMMKESGLINSFTTINILAEIMGYNINDSVINNTIDESKFVYHVDQRPWLLDDIEEY